MPIYYGLTNRVEVRSIARAVCDVLGHGSTNQGILMLIRTCAVETGMGTIQDPGVYKHGVGLYQHDKDPFEDTQRRTRSSDKAAISAAWGIEWDLIQHRDLAYSPLLSTIAARLHYKLVPDPFPLNLREQGEYWKKFYNSSLGKGTVEKFVQAARDYEVA